MTQNGLLDAMIRYAAMIRLAEKELDENNDSKLGSDHDSSTSTTNPLLQATGSLLRSAGSRDSGVQANLSEVWREVYGGGFGAEGD